MSLLPESRFTGPETNFGPHNQGNGLITLVENYVSRPAMRPHLKDILKSVLETDDAQRPNVRKATARGILQKHELFEDLMLG